ncbi:nose resistant to fluoxetine protein 6-like isoform X2 [Zootermopsis nevadensis]|uniref:nose resistant to fluoxetine protein 6-like isoform X2 n=1 Tax=Zootermopsis nevadensis TaxID=136037 RepID=UPI000B8ED69F|nr:nose resistant to fluoxetine protein 6-like isoform X2 [Zootermopsis nevadensis]
MIVILIVISLLPTVPCTDNDAITEVLPNSTIYSDKYNIPPSQSNNTLHAYNRPNRSNTELVGRKYSNSSEVEYFGVQKVSQNATEEDAGAAGGLLDDLVTQSFTPDEGGSKSGLEWLHNVYNPHLWGASPPGDLRTKCRADMKLYLAALNNGTVWAAKMTDASGRYSSQFLFGNNFWLGSHALCDELQLRDSNPEPPQFRVAFHVAKLQVALSASLSPASRQVFLGLCLPQSCGPADITSLLRPSSALQVLRVRPVPGDYSLLADTKFHILGGVLAVVCVLIAVGSCYELLLSRSQDNRQADGTVLPNCKEKVSLGLLSQLLLCFSAVRNGYKILNCNTPEDSLTSIHGLRFLSLAWVILVHTYLQVFAIAENKTLRTVTERNFMFQTISNATFSVDTFFFISGLLVTFLYYRTATKQHQPSDKRCSLKDDSVKFLRLLFYRFVRLTPAYLFVLGLVEVAMRALHNSSVFEPKIMDHLNCDNYWWRNALYINSLYPRREMCMLWSWYMANDTQFYVLGILLLLVSVRYFRVVVAAWTLFLVSSWCTTGFISYQHQYIARIQEPFAHFDALYDKPWTRLGPYLVGMATGWLLHETKCTLKMPTIDAGFTEQPNILLRWS